MKKIASMWLVLISINVYADFTRDSSTEIVTDTLAGLMWQDNEGTTNKHDSWVDAIEYCEDLATGGYGDWRMPNINELLSILDYEKTCPVHSIFQNVGNCAGQASYWSSTTINHDDLEPLSVYIEGGEIIAVYIKYDRYVRCVRTK